MTVSLSESYNKLKLIKWIAFATFCHPVLVSYAHQSISNILGNKSLFDLIGDQYENL
jgi:hypothetical protein